MYEIDEQQIRMWWHTFNPQNKLIEIRLLGTSTFSGYFKNVDVMINQIKPLLLHDNARYYGTLQAYFTLNELNDELYSREQHDIFVKKPKSTSTDGDVVRRRMILIDLDPSRSAGISASNEEFEKAHLKAVAIYRYLMSQGFKEPMITTSGNGYHCYLPCDMPNDDEHTELVKRFLQSLANMFSDDDVEVDEKVFNPARIDKLIGTWAKKGSDTEDRPWRISRILKVPLDMSPNDDALFKKIADLAPKEEPKSAPNRRPFTYNDGGNNAPFDLRTWLDKYGIVYKESSEGSGTKFALEHCPWEDTHSNRQKWDSALFLSANGQITFNCFHSHCKDRTWFDFRQFYEPDAYNKPAYQPQYTPRQFAPPKPKYEIKGEIPELGKKWLTMSQIKKVDITKLNGVKTGFHEIDSLIVKLYDGEVTLLSGSNASGKSSWLNSLILNIAEQGVPTALWSGELPEPILSTWIQMVAAGKRNLRRSNFGDDKYYVPSSVGERIDAWLEDKLFIYNSEYGNQWEQLFADMEELAKAGVKFFVLDNLMAMNIDLLGGDSKNDKQREVILKLKKFAKQHQVHIVLVAHPRKAMAFLRKNDISGTGDLSNAVDNIFIFHRVNNDFLKAGGDFFGQQYIQTYASFGNVCEIAKNRMFGVVDKLVGLHYEVESRRFKNTLDEEIHYGWETFNTEPKEIQFAEDGEEGDSQNLHPTQEEQAPASNDEGEFNWDDPFPPMQPLDEAPF